MYYSMAVRNCTLLDQLKTRKSNLVRGSTLPSSLTSTPQFKIQLSFPQKEYFPGESIGFDVKVKNPDGFHIEKVQVALIQYTTRVNGDSVRTHAPPLELNSVAMGRDGSHGNGAGNDIEWGGVLQIPEMDQATPPAYAGDADPVDLRYVLLVMVHKCNIGEGRVHNVIGDYPIRIGRREESPTIQPETDKAKKPTV